ncbi:MAG: hypothetical protein HQK49_12150 [Oligoflexia bacterium]|nr:hypothetical protein [Oligoflexia bacterium]
MRKKSNFHLISNNNVLKIKDKSNLLTASAKMRESLQILDQINGKANLIAFNAAIEGARTRGRLDSFSIVAEQILTQAVRNVELSEKLGQLVKKLHNVALRSTAARYYELSEDLIDKLDRNLFGRNCDVQAWAVFEANIKCLHEVNKLRSELDFKKLPADELHQKLIANDRVKWVKDLLDKVMSIYHVYSDIVLVDKEGLIVTSVKRPNLIGKQNVSDTDWFKAAMAGELNVSDMDWDMNIKAFVVRYSVPVLDEHKECIGVISTRFNWDYAQEMIDNGHYDDSVQAYIISKQGLVLANTDTSGLGVYREPMNWLDAGKDSMSGYSGYTIETARNGAPVASGYAKTKGYNTYKGKGWTALILSRLGNVDYEHLLHRVSRNGVTNYNEYEYEEDNEKSESIESINNHENDKSIKKKIESELVNDELIECMHNINELVDQINTTNHETNMLAINAAIQAGIAGTEGESFGVIAGEIGGLAEKSVAFVSKVNMTTKDLQTAVTSTVAARLSDAARDAADKIDRMLFERFCDIQAWSQMAVFRKATESGSDLNFQASDLLAKIQKIYEVYHDTFLVDATGKIIASALRRELIGQNQSNRKWFQDAIQGNVYYSDVYRSNTVNALTMTFSAPVTTWDGKIVGVITSRFNWDYIYDIIDAVIVDSKSRVNLVNSDGILIGSSDREQILEKSFKHLKAFTLLHQGQSGVHNEIDSSDGREYSVGFCKGKGHNAYSGKGWSVIIRRLNERVKDGIATLEEDKLQEGNVSHNHNNDNELKLKKVG